MWDLGGPSTWALPAGALAGVPGAEEVGPQNLSSQLFIDPDSQAHLCLTSDEQVLQEFQTSVVDCGNVSTSDSICTGDFQLELVNVYLYVLTQLMKKLTANGHYQTGN